MTAAQRRSPDERQRNPGLAFKLADRSRISRSLSSGRPLRAGPVGSIQATKCMRHHLTPRSCGARPSPSGEGEKGAFSRRAGARVLLQEARKPSPIPVGRPPAVVPAPSRSRPAQKKSGRRNADRRVNLPSASGMRPRACLSSPTACGEGQRGARSPVGVPPRRLRQRTNAAAQLQHALPGTRLLQALAASRLSQSSELLADRSWCRPGVFPEPPGDGSDEPPSAGTALAPAASVTRLPSCKLSEIRGLRIRNGDLCQ